MFMIEKRLLTTVLSKGCILQAVVFECRAEVSKGWSGLSVVISFHKDTQKHWVFQEEWWIPCITFLSAFPCSSCLAKQKHISANLAENSDLHFGLCFWIKLPLILSSANTQSHSWLCLMLSQKYPAKEFWI